MDCNTSLTIITKERIQAAVEVFGKLESVYGVIYQEEFSKLYTKATSGWRSLFGEPSLSSVYDMKRSAHMTTPILISNKYKIPCEVTRYVNKWSYKNDIAEDIVKVSKMNSNSMLSSEGCEFIYLMELHSTKISELEY